MEYSKPKENENESNKKLTTRINENLMKNFKK